VLAVVGDKVVGVDAEVTVVREQVIGAVQDCLGGVLSFHEAGMLRWRTNQPHITEPPGHWVDEEANIVPFREAVKAADNDAAFTLSFTAGDAGSLSLRHRRQSEGYWEQWRGLEGGGTVGTSLMWGGGGAECTGATVLDDLLVAFVDPCITKVQKTIDRY